MSVLLVVDDDASILHIFRRAFRDSGIVVETVESAAECLRAVPEVLPDVVVLDLVLPDSSGLDTLAQIHQLDAKMPVLLITAGGTSATAIEAMKLGAFDYVLKPLDIAQLRKVVDRAFEVRRLMQVPVEVAETSAAEEDGAVDLLVGRCPAMQDVYKAIGRVASQDVTVLILGDSGTGKELVARAIYQHSKRAQGPFLAVNCAAIPDTLLESELFGHEKGAFTGADRTRIGKFEQCCAGTLFLDEIGDMSAVLQSKVLRIIQEQRFERVGGNETVKTNVRLIAATNRNLEEMVGDGKFRADLYYRLNVFAIQLPPLRERTEDLPLMVEYFLKRFNRELGKSVREIAPDVIGVLQEYSWPGNVRELQSVVKQALLQSSSPVLTRDCLPRFVSSPGTIGALGTIGPSVPGDDLDALITERLQADSSNLYDEAIAMAERKLISRVLEHTDGNQVRAAKILGIARGSLRKKIRSLGIRIGHTVEASSESEDEDDGE